jgi:hypothetical protein
MIMKLKKTGIIVLAIAITLLLLVIAVTPIFAWIPPNPDGDNGGPGNPTPSGQGNTYDGFVGKFLVIMCGSFASYGWVEEWQHGKTLAEPVSKEGTCYCCARFPCPGTVYKIEIPAGTVVSGYYPGQGRVIHLEVKCVDGQPYFSPNLKLSQPATLYQLVDGKWVKVLSFTEVLNGKAS